MPICTDRATTELNKKGYNLVRYPRSDIQPLDILAGEHSPLEWLGPLSKIWKSDKAPPSSTQQNVPAFGFQQTNDFKGSIGVRILQGLLKNIGGATAASDARISSSLSFTYESPRRTVVSPFDIGDFLQAGDLNVEHPMVRRYLGVESATESHFYVISEVLTARKLLVRIGGSDSASLTADIAAVQGLLAANASVVAKMDNESQIAFDGNEELTFAFRAYEIGYMNGKWIVINATNKTLSHGYISPLMNAVVAIR